MEQLAPLAPADDGAFEFAHLSDPHLTDLGDVDASTLRDKRILGWLSWRRKRAAYHDRAIVEQFVDGVRSAKIEDWVVTGDLTHIGLPQEVDDAANWLSSLGSPERVSVIPGNHDLYVADPADTMYQTWAPFMCSDDGTEGFPWVRLRGPVALIGLDSAWAAPWLMATGELGRIQRERLRTVLDVTGRAGYVRICLVHHAPLPGLDKWRKRLVDAPALQRVLAESGVELILHGHGHRLRMQDGPIPIVQAPSASASARHGNHRAAWLRCRIERRGREHEIAVTANGLEGEIARHVFTGPIVDEL